MNKLKVLLLLVTVFAALGGCQQGGTDVDCAVDCFPNGVAAGDVDQSSVVLWARASFAGSVRFEYGTDEDFFDTDGRRDVEVVIDGEEIIPSKARITGLTPGTQYYYRACPGRCASDATNGSEARGSFRTPHVEGDHGLRFGVSSCWQSNLRPFISIKNVPERDLDFFVALGDTVYADSARARTLKQFRAANEKGYSQDESPDDNMFALARASTAFFVDIDDHEVVNNFSGGARPRSQRESCECKGTDVTNAVLEDECGWNLCFCNPNNDPEGDCDKAYINDTDLFNDAIQAWREYNPVRDDEVYGSTGDPRTAGEYKIYRYRSFGSDAAMFMLDARSFRDKADIGATFLPGRTMLGKAQRDDLLDDLRSAEDEGITWKFILVPEPIQRLGEAVTAGDRFEGYAYERSLILDFIERECITNVVFVSGDIHGTVTNNLTYSIEPTIQRFSSSWDISAGPAAYAPPIGAKITQKTNPGGTREFNDALFGALLNRSLAAMNQPLVGLDSEEFHVQPLLYPWNRFVPATLLEGDYVSAHVYSWTEFEIDPETQNLLVTVHAVDWYDKGVDPPDQDSFIATQFEVEPRSSCRPIPCLSNDDCCEDCFCNLLGIVETGVVPYCVQLGSVDNGDLCSSNAACRSDRCLLTGVCGGCQPAGDACGEIDDCCDGSADLVCSTLTCLGSGSLAALTPCTTDDACRSGRCVDNTCLQLCGDGFCDGVEQCGGNDVSGQQCRSDCGRCPNESVCGDDDMCQSGLCNGGTCMFPLENGRRCVRDDGCESGLCNGGTCTAPQANGSICVRDVGCESGLCNAGICTAPQGNGSACIRDVGCQSGLCDLALCTVPNSRPAVSPCESGDACRSESCSGGTCDQICGDGYCDGTEQCGGNDVTGLQCRSDCGRCDNGELCGDDSMCQSRLCNAGTCTEPQPNGSVCARDVGCESGLCNAGTCTEPLANGNACVRDAGCRSDLCDVLICTAPRSKGWLSACADNRACESGSCTAGTCTKP